MSDPSKVANLEDTVSQDSENPTLLPSDEALLTMYPVTLGDEMLDTITDSYNQAMEPEGEWFWDFSRRRDSIRARTRTRNVSPWPIPNAKRWSNARRGPLLLANSSYARGLSRAIRECSELCLRKSGWKHRNWG
jgi:hypothetical protein